MLRKKPYATIRELGKVLLTETDCPSLLDSYFQIEVATDASNINEPFNFQAVVAAEKFCSICNTSLSRDARLSSKFIDLEMIVPVEFYKQEHAVVVDKVPIDESVLSSREYIESYLHPSGDKQQSSARFSAMKVRLFRVDGDVAVLGLCDSRAIYSSLRYKTLPTFDNAKKLLWWVFSQTFFEWLPQELRSSAFQPSDRTLQNEVNKLSEESRDLVMSIVLKNHARQLWSRRIVRKPDKEVKLFDEEILLPIAWDPVKAKKLERLMNEGGTLSFDEVVRETDYRSVLLRDVPGFLIGSCNEEKMLNYYKNSKKLLSNVSHFIAGLLGDHVELSIKPLSSFFDKVCFRDKEINDLFRFRIKNVEELAKCLTARHFTEITRNGVRCLRFAVDACSRGGSMCLCVEAQEYAPSLFNSGSMPWNWGRLSREEYMISKFEI